jgi:hypothetical protein
MRVVLLAALHNKCFEVFLQPLQKVELGSTLYNAFCCKNVVKPVHDLLHFVLGGSPYLAAKINEAKDFIEDSK